MAESKVFTHDALKEIGAQLACFRSPHSQERCNMIFRMPKTTFGHRIALGILAPGRRPALVNACELRDPWEFNLDIGCHEPDVPKQRAETYRKTAKKMAIALGDLLMEYLAIKADGEECTSGFLISIDGLKWEFANAVYELEQFNIKNPQFSVEELIAESASVEAAPGTDLGRVRDMYVEKCLTLQKKALRIVAGERARAIAGGKPDPGPEVSCEDLAEVRNLYIKACQSLQEFDVTCRKL